MWQSALGALALWGIVIYLRHVWRRSGVLKDSIEKNRAADESMREARLARAAVAPTVAGVICPSCRTEEAPRVDSLEVSLKRVRADAQFKCKHCGYAW